jgi:hypothetical protein
MPYNLLLLPLLGGFFFLNLSHLFRFRAQRSDGYRMLAETAIAGFFLLCVARIITEVVRPLVSDDWIQVWRDFSPFSYSFTGGASFLLGPVFAVLFNLFKNREAALDIEIEKRGNALNQLFHKAQKANRPLSITLDSRKWYVGYAAESPNLNPQELYFRILPILSGYRQKDSLEVVQTVSYKELIEDPAINANDLVITIPLRDIKTANLFDESIFASYFAKDDEAAE